MSNAAERLKVRPPKTARGRRFLKNRAPKVKENPKELLILRGEKTCPEINQVLQDIHTSKRSQSRFLKRRMHSSRPFEDFTNYSNLCEKQDCSLLCYGSNSKKRPMNLVMCRLFDYQLLNMYEFGVNRDTYKSMKHFIQSSKSTDKSFRYDSKPLIVFQGEDFANDRCLKEIRNFFVDFFRAVNLKQLNLMGIDHVWVVTARLVSDSDGKPVSNSSELLTDDLTGGRHPSSLNMTGSIRREIYLRHYRVWYSQSSNPKLPCANLEEIGPRLDLTLRRQEHASSEVQKQARQRPAKLNAHLKLPQKKNVSHNVFGERTGTLHVNRSDQDLSKLKYKKIKVLRKMDKDRKKKQKRTQKQQSSKRVTSE